MNRTKPPVGKKQSVIAKTAPVEKQCSQAFFAALTSIFTLKKLLPLWDPESESNQAASRLAELHNELTDAILDYLKKAPKDEKDRYIPEHFSIASGCAQCC